MYVYKYFDIYLPFFRTFAQWKSGPVDFTGPVSHDLEHFCQIKGHNYICPDPYIYEMRFSFCRRALYGSLW